MFKNRFLKIIRSLIKLIMPYISNLLLVLRINRRTINYLNEKSYFSNNLQNFTITREGKIFQPLFRLGRLTTEKLLFTLLQFYFNL